MSFADSLTSKLQSSPSSMAMAFSNVSPARDMLTPHVSHNMDLTQVAYRAADNIQKAQDGLGAIASSSSQGISQEAGTFQKVGLEVAASVASAPAMAGLVAGLSVINPVLGVAVATGAIIHQATQYASIGVQALSSNSPQTQKHTSELNDNIGDDRYASFADGLDSPTAQQSQKMSPAFVPAPEGQAKPALFWGEEPSEEQLVDTLKAQRDHNIGMADSVAGLDRKRLELPPPALAA